MTEVLYISYDGMTDPLGQSQVIPYLIGLGKEGFHFTLLSAEKRTLFEQKRNEVGEWLQKNNIDWQPVLYTKYPPVFSTVFDIYKMQRRAFALHKLKNFSVVHCRSYVASLIGLRMKKKAGTKFIFDMRGFWADERAEGGIWSLRNPFYHAIYKFFKKKEIEFLITADQTISLTENAKNEILSWPAFTNNTVPIKVIPCCVDLEFFDAEKISEDDKKNCRDRLNIAEGAFVLSYLGSLGTWYLLDEMLAFFSRLQKKIPGAVFLFISNTDKNEILEKAAAHSIPAEKIIAVNARREEVPVLLAISTFMIFLIKNSYAKKASSPVKLGEALAMKIPVICTGGIGDVSRLFEQYAIGFELENTLAVDFEKVIDRIVAGYSFPRLRSAAENVFSLRKGIAGYTKVYQSILNPKHS